MKKRLPTRSVLLTPNFAISSLVALLIFTPSLLFAQTIYTWEDDQGVLHFSDSPGGKSTKALTLPDHQANAPAPSFENLPSDTSSNKTVPNKKTKTALQPEPLSLSFQSPQSDQTIRSNQGHINVTSKLNRKLVVGEHLQLIFNDASYAAPNTNGEWQLKSINRGTHTISIQAFRDGKLIASSNTITVHLHRASIK
ncbi:DUF4124 domain-containing protein [Vibrio lamellibrachiae]|uniref:DUF4124 domain-containing protein n=1 Tax=Vibrio lamellibrachiae TaxID=2910253 RepID=UPI003D1384C2